MNLLNLIEILLYLDGKTQEERNAFLRDTDVRGTERMGPGVDEEMWRAINACYDQRGYLIDSFGKRIGPP